MVDSDQLSFHADRGVRLLQALIDGKNSDDYESIFLT